MSVLLTNFRLFSLLLSLPFLCSSNLHAEELSLETLLINVRDNNSDLKSLEHRIDVLKAQQISELRIDDPRLSLEYSNVPLANPGLANSPMSGVQLKVSQHVTRPQLNEATTQAAHANVHRQRHLKNQAIVDLERGLGHLYWHLSYYYALESLTARHLELLDALLQSGAGRYSVGQDQQIGLLRLQLLSEGLKDQLDDYARTKIQLSSQLQAAQWGDIHALIEPAGLAVDFSPEPLGVEAFLERAHQNNPRGKMFQAELEHYKYQGQVADLSRFKGIDLWAGYRYRQPTDMDAGQDLISLGIAAPIPLDRANQQAAQKQAALSAQHAVQAQYQQWLQSLAAQIEGEYAAWNRAAKKVERYKNTMLPIAKMAVSSATNNYGLSEGNFESMYQAQLALIKAEKTLLKAVLETRLHACELHALAGGHP